MENKITSNSASTFYKSLVEVVRGVEKDFTSGSLTQAVVLLSIPMVLEMMMESIFALVDIIYVSHLGAAAIATVGITESLITLVYALGIGISTATTAMVARRIGEKNERGASKTAIQSIYTGIFVSLLIAIPGVYLHKELLSLMGVGATEHAGYAAIMLGGNASIMLLFIINAVFRSAGNAMISMRIMAVANGINLLLDPLFIFGWGPIPAMGVEGAAIATTTGRSIAVLYQLYLLFRGQSNVKPRRSDMKLDVGLIVQLIKLSGGGIFQYFIATSSWIGLVRILAVLGDAVVAGYTIGIRVIIFALLPSVGISNAAATLVGQNLGANKAKRAEQSAWFTAKLNAAWMGFLSLILMYFAEEIIQLVSQDKQVVQYGVESLRYISIGFVFYGVGMVMVNSLNGAGDTYTPTWINIVCFWAFEVPLAYWLTLQMGWGAHGVYFSIVAADACVALCAVVIFKQGKWKLKKV